MTTKGSYDSMNYRRYYNVTSLWGYFGGWYCQLTSLQGEGAGQMETWGANGKDF